MHLDPSDLSSPIAKVVFSAEDGQVLTTYTLANGVVLSQAKPAVDVVIDLDEQLIAFRHSDTKFGEMTIEVAFRDLPLPSFVH
jgi:hypothetical protein